VEVDKKILNCILTYTDLHRAELCLKNYLKQTPPYVARRRMGFELCAILHSAELGLFAMRYGAESKQLSFCLCKTVTATV
jgi:hypothetical protein